MKLPTAGELDRQITIRRKLVSNTGAHGTPVVTPQPIVASRLWAQVIDMLPSRSESVIQGAQVGRNQVRVRIRYMVGIDSSMEILVHDDRERVLQIIGGPAELGRRQFLELYCEEIKV